MELAISEKVLLQDGDINKEFEDLIFDPFNERNNEISINQVQNILTAYGVPDKVHNINLYKFFRVPPIILIVQLLSDEYIPSAVDTQ